MSRIGKSLTAIFFVMTLVFAATLVMSAINYSEFYRALSKFAVSLVSADPALEQDKPNVTVVLAVINNSSYVGFKLKRVWFTLSFLDNSQYTYLVGDGISLSEPTLLSPYQNLTLQKTTLISMGRETTQRFLTIYNQSLGNIKWMMECDVIVATFVGEINVISLKAYI